MGVRQCSKIKEVGLLEVGSLLKGFEMEAHVPLQPWSLYAKTENFGFTSTVVPFFLQSIATHSAIRGRSSG